MTTPARYPSAETVVSRTPAIIHGAYIDRPQMDGIIKAAVDLERERVAKEVGEYFRCDECHEPAGTRQVCRRCVRLEIENEDAGEVSCWRVAGGTWVDGEPLPCDYKDAEQNGWAIELAYTEQALPKKDSNETHVVEAQNSAVKVPDGLIEALRRQRQVDEDGSECGVSRQAVEEAISILQSLTHPTEPAR